MESFYSPCPEQIDVPFPRNYREYLVDEVMYLRRQVPTTPAELNAWLWTCADCVAHLAEDPQSEDQTWASIGVLADALAQSTGRALPDCYSLIQHRVKIRKAA
jgi:hypothetical protein